MILVIRKHLKSYLEIELFRDLYYRNMIIDEAGKKQDVFDGGTWCSKHIFRKEERLY